MHFSESSSAGEMPGVKGETRRMQRAGSRGWQ